MTPLPDWSPEQLATLGIPLRRMEVDSRRILPGDVFMAFPGGQTDGRDFIPMALEKGAVGVVWDPADGFTWNPAWQVPNLAVPQLRERSGEIAGYVLGYPGRDMVMIGITGTNGKTSLSHWLAQAFSLLEQKAALIGTVGSGFYGELTSSTHTTPDPVVIQQKLAEYRRQGAHVVTMEVSSHALDQGRANGVPFGTALFTNLTRDHLDYHGTMEAYGEAKARLFHWEGLRHAVINVDDAFGAHLAGTLDASVQVVTYGLNGGDVRPLSLLASLDGLSMRVATPWGEVDIRSSLLGHFNASNLLACLATLCVNGISLADAARVLAMIQPARGRMQRIGGAHEPLVVIDYAHTPDSLEKALETLGAIRPQGSRLFCVFGCGGDRDAGKRPMMGEIAARLADVPVVTSDNPRSEAPAAIIDQIVAGMQGTNPMVEMDREAAIHQAIGAALAGDIVLIAGKGHEEYQDINGVKRPFSDFRVAEEALTVWGRAHDADAL